MKEVSIISRKLPARARSDRYAGGTYAVAGPQQQAAIDLEGAFASMMSRWFVRDTENKGIRPADYDGEAVGLYSNSYMSALGPNTEAGSEPVAGATELSKLTDVILTTPADGQVLTYDTALGKWVNRDPEAAAGLDETALAEYLADNRYATQDWVTQQGYAKATDIPSLEGYATQTWASGQFALRTVAINAGAGLTGGGNLTASRTLSLATTGTAGTYTKVTTDAYGRVTKGATLQAGDIPTLSISKISGLQAELDGKLDAADFTELFEKVYVSGSGYAIRAKLALYTEGWLSAKGMNSDAGGTVVAGASSWDEIEGKPSAFPPSAHTHTVAQITDFPKTWVWADVSGKPDIFQDRNQYVVTDWNNYKANGAYHAYPEIGSDAAKNAPSSSYYYGTLITFNGGVGTAITQIYAPNDALYEPQIRTCWNDTKWTGWKRLAYTTSNVASASKLQTARAISLNGAVTGSTTFDGGANADIATTFNASGLLDSLKKVDGAGSGLDADLLDGKQYTDFFRIKDYNAVGIAKSMSSINATPGSSNAWNVPANASFRVENNNNAFVITLGGTTNDRNANIQVGHNEYSTYANVLGNLYLNRLGGNVSVGDVSPDHKLNVAGGMYASSYLQVGSARLKWDSANGALYVEKADGTQCGFYATGFLSAKGMNSDAGGTVVAGASSWDEIEGKPNTLAGYGIQTEADGRYFRRRVDWIEDTTTDSGDLWGNGIYLNATGNVGKNNTFPSNYGILLNFAYYDNNFRLQIHATAESLRYNYRFDSGRLTTWRELLSEYNYTNYTVTKGGAGASGTWGIGITGNAASATKLQTARTLWGQSFNGTANVTGSLTGVTDIAMTGKLTGFAAITSGYGDGNRRTRMDTQFKMLAATTGWAGGLSQYTNDGSSNLGTIAGAYGVADELQYYFYGGTYTTPVIVIRDGKVAINTLSAQHMLHVNGGIYSDEYVQVGSARLKYDSSTGALYVQKADGTQCGFYATGFLSAKGANSDAGGTVAGGGSGEVHLMDIVDMVDAWKLIVANYPVDYVLRWPSWSEVTGKPSTFSPSSHTHTLSQISDLHSSWDSYLKSAPSFATTSSNVASATKLQTARTLWGQSFNGTTNVSGDMTNVGSIKFTPGTNNRNLILNSGGIRILTTSASGWATGIAVWNSGNTTKLGEICGGFGTQNAFTYAYFGGTYDSPAITIPTSKNVGIGTTSPSYRLHVAGSAYATGGFQNGSDVRYKHILADLPLTPAQVAAAPAFLFRWKDGEDKSVHAGTSAQYWRDVLPQTVMEGGDGRLSMQYGVAALLSAVAVARSVIDHEERLKKLEAAVKVAV